VPEHRAAKIAAVHGERAKLYAKRKALLEPGPDALAEMTHRDKRLAYRAVEELYALLDRHGDGVMRTAITAAVAKNTLFVSAVRSALPKGARIGRAPGRATARPRGAESRCAMSTDLNPLLKRLNLANARRAWRDLAQRAEKEE